jgi:hypothetical protein
VLVPEKVKIPMQDVLQVLSYAPVIHERNDYVEIANSRQSRRPVRDTEHGAGGDCDSGEPQAALKAGYAGTLR